MASSAARCFVGLLSVSVVVSLGMSAPADAGQPASVTGPSLLPGPDASSTSQHGLSDVSALSVTDAWAVGYHTIAPLTYETWVTRWNGRSWRHVASPNPGNKTNRLFGVDAVSSSDVWAVGATQNATDKYQQALIEHWDGTAWTHVPSPQPGRASSLTSVSASSADDVWAVGTIYDGSYNGALIEHWDGTTWTTVDSPKPPGSSLADLSGVTAVSTGNVWAVGTYDYTTITGGFRRDPIIEHWNGTRWSIVDSPAPLDTTYLFAVSGDSAKDIWAVGTMNSGSLDTATFIEHWDGTSWTRVSSPRAAGNRHSLRSVSVVSPDDVWAVGTHGAARQSHTLTEHWDGTSWSIVASPDQALRKNYLGGVSAASSTAVFAVGAYIIRRKSRNLIEHWDGTSWRISP